MSQATAERAFDWIFSSRDRSKLALQVAKPLLNFDLVRVQSSVGKGTRRGIAQRIDYRRSHNLAVVTDDMLRYFRDEQIEISTSLDGPAFIHDANRPAPEETVTNSRPGTSSVPETRRARTRSALITTTRLSSTIRSDQRRNREAGFSVYLSSANKPYGFAVRTGRRRDMKPTTFLSFIGKDWLIFSTSIAEESISPKSTRRLSRRKS